MRQSDVVVVVVVVVRVGQTDTTGLREMGGGVLIDGSSCPRGEEHRQTAGHL